MIYLRHKILTLSTLNSQPFSKLRVTQMASHQEQILESARRNNTELLLDLKVETGEDVVSLINKTRELITNNTPLHLACSLGNWDWIDIVLDIPLVEIDPLNHESSTPLHLAVKFANDDPEFGYFIIDNLLDAGLDPRIRDKSGYKPAELVIDNDKLIDLLESAEYAISMELTEEEQLSQSVGELLVAEETELDGPSDDDDVPVEEAKPTE